MPPGGGNNQIDPRFIALFSTFNITAEQNAVQKIFNTILQNYLTKYPVEMEMLHFSESLVSATSELYSTIKEKLPRTPIKFHYVFNIRDISKIFQGFCQLTYEKFSTKEELIKLWKNEALRVFADKLLSINDKKIVENILNESISKNFSDYAQYALTDPCIYGDFSNIKFDDEEEDADAIDQSENRKYEQFLSYESIKEILVRALEAYKSAGNQEMNLVFYNDAIDHLLRIHRIIRIEQGNALLIGIGGSGKQSLAKLATFLAKYELWTIKITSRFEEKHFKEQLVELFKKFDSTEPVTPVVFLFTDEQVLDEGFMELINNILTTGIVPAIFEKADKDAIIEKWKSEASRLNLPETKDVAYNLFVNKVKENLHMIIAMSPSGDKLRNRCRNFPGLISNTTIDWFFEWPRDALFDVSSNLLSNFNTVPDDSKSVISEHMIYVHLSVRNFSLEALQSQKRYIYTTPKNFLDYIKNFKILYEQYLNQANEQIDRLEKGLVVLQVAAENIEILAKTVESEEVKVSEFLQILQEVNDELNIKTKLCNENTKSAKDKEVYLEQRTAEIMAEQEIIEKNVVEINALIVNIKKETLEIDKQDIDTYSMSSRFDSDIGQVLKALFFALKDKSNTKKWDAIADSEIQSFLGKSAAVFNKILNLDETYKNVSLQATDTAANKIKDIIISDKNKSVKAIRTYLINFNKFCRKTYEKIESEISLKKKVEEKEIKLADLDSIKKSLILLEEDKITLENESAIKQKEFNETNAKLIDLRATLSAATDLFKDLRGENTRWTADKEALIKSKEKLIGDCLLGSAFLSYCGPFSFEFRNRMIYDIWKQDINAKSINVTPEFSVSRLLASELIVSQWNLEGLPDDDLSVQNGILTVNASRWPLCIDPEMQAINWIKKKEASCLKVITFNMENYMKHVIGAIKNGGSILVENINENIDPNINPVLEKNYRIKAGIIKINLDGTEIDVDPKFRMFMTTKLSNPHYTPEVMAKTVVINYSVTMDGLDEQLLNEVVRHEYPSLEETRKKLVDEMNQNKITLKQCEDGLLKALSDSDGDNILNNQSLILTLKETKKKAIEVKISLDNSETTKKDIYIQRSNYKAVAKRGSILYFAMSSLRLISPMYEYSLSAFMNVYRNSLDEAKPDTILHNRLENIKRKLTQLIYEYTCLSIFERHKIMFSFHMRTMIMKYEESLSSLEMMFFLRGNLLDAKKQKEISWMSELAWQDLDGINQISEVFKSLMHDVIANEEEWRAWYDLEKPEDNPLPNDYDKKITLLQKLLVIRVFRKDRIYNAIKNFIRQTMGEFFINPPAINMDKIYNQSNEKTPILFILSPGVDPMSYVTQLAGKKGFLEKKFRYMSLGQKQEKEATDMILDGVKRGLWVLLQNCDLLSNWLKELEIIIDNIDKPKKDFRLWLTTAPIDEFPIGILQKSFKVVTEPPDGLPLNMNRVYNSISEESLENDCSHFAYKPLVYVLSFFHSVLQDRKKFGKIGWNIIYDFNESDFQISKKLLSMYLNKISNEDAIPWSSLKYLIGEAMYGGRVTDDYDRRVMMTYLNEYMGDFIFDMNQKFFFSQDAHDYSIPEIGPHDIYVKAANDMPNIYSPEVIGLNSNAEIDYFSQASKSIWGNLLVLQETTGSSASSNSGNDKVLTKEVFVLELAENLLNSKLPDKFDILAVNRKFPEKQPIEAVLVQEIERYNTLNEKMRNSLTDLIKSLNGEIATNSEIEDIMNSLYNGTIPIQWKNVAPETQKSFGNWIEQYQKRYVQYANWLDNGEPAVMWLSGLHVPASYLKAIIQKTSRDKGWPLDKVDTYTVVTNIYNPQEIKEKPEFGCYISGLFLEGAEWSLEKNSLERQQ